MDTIRGEIECRRGVALPGQLVLDPSEWRGSELARRSGWFLHFEDGEISDLIGMCRSVRMMAGNDPGKLIDIPPGTFDLGKFSKKNQPYPKRA